MARFGDDNADSATQPPSDSADHELHLNSHRNANNHSTAHAPLSYGADPDVDEQDDMSGSGDLDDEYSLHSSVPVSYAGELEQRASTGSRMDVGSDTISETSAYLQVLCQDTEPPSTESLAETQHTEGPQSATEPTLVQTTHSHTDVRGYDNSTADAPMRSITNEDFLEDDVNVATLEDEYGAPAGDDELAERDTGRGPHYVDELDLLQAAQTAAMGSDSYSGEGGDDLASGNQELSSENPSTINIVQKTNESSSHDFLQNDAQSAYHSDQTTSDEHIAFQSGPQNVDVEEYEIETSAVHVSGSEVDSTKQHYPAGIESSNQNLVQFGPQNVNIVEIEEPVSHTIKTVYVIKSRNNSPNDGTSRDDSRPDSSNRTESSIEERYAQFSSQNVSRVHTDIELDATDSIQTPAENDFEYTSKDPSNSDIRQTGSPVQFQIAKAILERRGPNSTWSAHGPASDRKHSLETVESYDYESVYSLVARSDVGIQTDESSFSDLNDHDDGFSHTEIKVRFGGPTAADSATTTRTQEQSSAYSGVSKNERSTDSSKQELTSRPSLQPSVASEEKPASNQGSEHAKDTAAAVGDADSLASKDDVGCLGICPRKKKKRQMTMPQESFHKSSQTDATFLGKTKSEKKKAERLRSLVSSNFNDSEMEICQVLEDEQVSGGLAAH